MDQKEVVSGNPHPLQEFTDTMAQWYRSFKAARTEQGGERRRPRSSYPADTSPYWIVHVIDFSNSESAARGLRKRGITQSELGKRDGTSILMVTDASGLTLGFDILDQGWSSSFNGLTEQELLGTVNKVVLLLQRCMDAPMDGGMPRQPSRLRINVKILHRVLLQDTLKQGNSRWDIALWNQVLRDWNLMDQAVAPDFSPRWPPVYYCNVCKRRSFPTQLRECSQCKAVFYCENKCFPTDSEHQRWCAKLAGYMDNGAQLADLPFSYAAEVTTESFSLEDFLCKNKLVGSYWLHWSLLVHSSQLQITHSNAYHSWLEDHSNAYEPLKQEADVLMFGPDPLNPPHLKNPLMSWHQYYEWRGLSLSSVVAPVLSSALSVYYIITSLVPKHFPDLNLLKKQTLRIHILESYREFHTMLTFWELSVLLPHVTFELVFIGGHLPGWGDKVLHHFFIQKINGSVSITDSSLIPDEEADKRIIRVTVHRCTYHTLQGPVPDLVVGFKPAFLRNDSWFSTLPKLQTLRVPAFFCEISELRCESSEEVMNKATGGTVSPPTINPFHCPLRINGGDNRLPRYSNGFIFHLIYKPLANVQHPQTVTNSTIQSDHTPSPVESPHLTFWERRAAAQHCRHSQGDLEKGHSTTTTSSSSSPPPPPHPAKIAWFKDFLFLPSGYNGQCCRVSGEMNGLGFLPGDLVD